MRTGHGAPTINTVGNVGDIYRDLDTDVFYKLESIDSVETIIDNFVTRTDYHPDTAQHIWVPTVEAGGGDIDGLIARTLTEVGSETAEKIGNSVFEEYTILTDVNFPAVTSVGDSAFRSCTSLKNVALPAVDSVSASAFYNCSGLTDLQLPMATYIGDSSLYNCSGLTNVNLPCVRTVDQSAFGYCTSLETIVLPSAWYIAKSAFNNCTALKKVDLACCTQIAMNAFENCKALEMFIVRTETFCTLGSNAFPGTGYIYVPAALIDSYKNNNKWGTYADQIRALEDYTVDGTITGELDPTKI